MKQALLIGSSDGIGHELARQLCSRGWSVIGLSRSPCRADIAGYRHVVVDVRAAGYAQALEAALGGGQLDLCVYCAGTGELFDAANLGSDGETLRVNLVGLADTVACVVPRLLASGGGTFAGLSSLGDALPSRFAPGYAASKIGMSYYLEGLAGALRDRGVSIVNVRLGFVDTKMAKSPVKPFMLSVEVAARRILEAVLAKAPRSRVNIPRRTALLMWLIARLSNALRVLRLAA